MWGLVSWLYVVVGVIYWAWQALCVWKTRQKVPVLSQVRVQVLPKWPKVSIIIPARNEEKTIAASLKTRLREDYPREEIILIDDRSTDRTGEILDEVAKGDTRVKVIHVKEIPSNWIGKIYAMQKGIEQATGDWLLFSDADIIFKTNILRQAIAYAEEKNLDHLAVVPEIWSKTLLLSVLHLYFIRFTIIGTRAWEVEKEDSKSIAGVGAFSLVRRSAFEKTRGLAWMKLELVDDLTMGQMIKDSGAKSGLVNGRDLIGVYYYDDAWDMAKGIEHAGFAVVGRFSLVRMLALTGLMLLCELAPFILLFSPNMFQRFLGLLLIVLSTGVSLIISKWLNRPGWTAVFWPVGVIVMAIFGVRLGILGKIRGGVYWRGTFYPTELLKRGQRCRFG